MQDTRFQSASCNTVPSCLQSDQLPQGRGVAVTPFEATYSIITGASCCCCSSTACGAGTKYTMPGGGGGSDTYGCAEVAAMGTADMVIGKAVVAVGACDGPAVAVSVIHWCGTAMTCASAVRSFRALRQSCTAMQAKTQSARWISLATGD